jgi:DNA polymerase-3 subunit epsilon
MDTALSGTDLIALDLETTGLRSQKDVIVSIGSVTMNYRRIQWASAKYWVVNPGAPLSAESITIHELTPSDVAEAPR